MSTIIPTTIAVDPGSKSGVAIWRGDKLVAYGLARSTAEEVKPKLDCLSELATKGGVPMERARFAERPTFVTEAQYLKAPPATEKGREDREDSSAAGRFTAALSVHSNAVTWRVLARIMLADVVEPVQAASWRSTFGIAKGQGRPDLKTQAVDLCRERLKVDVKEDVAEAILIGLHAHVHRLGASLPPTLSWVLAMRLARKAATARANATKRGR